MRETEASGWIVQNSPETLMRALRLAAVALGIGVVMTTGVARAQDDDDDKTFEEKIIGGIMAGVGGTTMENRGIDYRERSPLVVPPKLDLPPPETVKGEITAPNWPKDPDEKRRKAAIKARQQSKPTPWEAARPLTPDELNVGRTAAGSAKPEGDSLTPGASASPMLSPSQLGYNGSFSGLFGGKKNEEAAFNGEPTRNSLTEPPPGYQTPSPNFAYGTGAMQPLNNTHFDVMKGKETTN